MAVDTHLPVLRTMVDQIRFITNEPSIEAKYTDARLWPLINQCAAQVMRDVVAVQENPIVVRHRITFVADQYDYALPPYVGEVFRMGTYDETNSVWTGFVEPRSRWNPMGPGVEFLGQAMIRFAGGSITAGDTFDLEFVPSGELQIHVGSVPWGQLGHSYATADYTKLVLAHTDEQVELGTFDRRPNAYVGQVLRVYDGPVPLGKAFFPISEHAITSYDGDKAEATVSPPMPSDWAEAAETDRWTYEVVPVFGKKFIDAVTMRVILMVLQLELPEQAGSANMEYQLAKRALLLSWSQFQSITGRNFAKDVVGDRYYAGGC